ncbi:MAG: hypothetical protein COA43_09680 [Robiginitomaculum sp.]|nr:MAG: hypothetical protein COA43_09680 [Robiginitomaculum sp.]
MIYPSANTKDYRISKRIPDSIFGLKILHLLLVSSGWSKPAGLNIETELITRRSDEGRIKTLVVRPKNAPKNLPVIVHLHGGGYAVGSPSQDFLMMKRYMDVRPCIFIAPQYRRSLRHPYPAGIEDCYDALLWAREHAEEYGGRSDQIFIMGESGGGGLTAALCLLARDRGEVNISCQFPLYGMFDDREENFTKCDPELLVWSKRRT